MPEKPDILPLVICLTGQSEAAGRHEKTERERKERQHLPTLARHRAWHFYRFTRVFFEAAIRQACSPQERNLRLCDISDLSRVTQSVVELFKPRRLAPSPFSCQGKVERRKERKKKWGRTIIINNASDHSCDIRRPSE